MTEVYAVRVRMCTCVCERVSVCVGNLECGVRGSLFAIPLASKYWRSTLAATNADAAVTTNSFVYPANLLHIKLTFSLENMPPKSFRSVAVSPQRRDIWNCGALSATPLTSRGLVLRIVSYEEGSVLPTGCRMPTGLCLSRTVENINGPASSCTLQVHIQRVG